MDTFFQDVRFGLRMLAKHKGFTTVAVLTLALGIGANTAIFSLMNAIMLRSLPVRNPEQLVALRWRAQDNPGTHQSYYWGGCPGEETGATACSFSYPMYEQLRGNREVFSGVFGFVPPSEDTEITAKGETSQAQGDLISGDFFSTLGVQAAAGRVLDTLDDVAGARPVVTVSYSYWRKHFGGDPSLVGATILLNGAPFTVSGVAAPGFEGLEVGMPRQFWIPLASRFFLDARFPKERETDAGSVWLQMMARLKPGVSVEQAEAAVSARFASMSTSGPGALFKPEQQPRIELPVASRGFAALRREFSSQLFVLMSAVGLILLVACANVAGLMLARAVSREKETALRFALGSGRWRIARELLTESLMLAFAGGALGVLVAHWGASTLSQFFARNAAEPRNINVKPDVHVLAFTIGISSLVGVLAGLAPALRGSSVDVLPALKKRGTECTSSTGGGGKRPGLGALLVIAQTAVSVLVLTVAGLLLRTLINLESTDTGFDKRNVLLFDVDARLSKYKDEKVGQLSREIQRRLASAPGVLAASYSSSALLSGSNMTTTFHITDALTESGINVEELGVGPDFFQTMRIPALAGRTFLPSDYENSHKPQPMVINQSFARRFFRRDNPLGRFLTEGDAKAPDYQIVGVVRDTKYESLRRKMRATAYFPMLSERGSFEVRTTMNPKALILTVRHILSELDGNLVLLNAKTQLEQIDHLLYQERLVASLSVLFAALALTLACIGVYGLLAFDVTRRTHEIGVRMALGAERRRICFLIVRKGVVLVVLGIVLGIAMASVLVRYMETLLYGVRPMDPGTFAGVSALLIVVGAAACYLPARRAMDVDPMIALRYE